MTYQQFNDACIPDGIYRMEFTAGEARDKYYSNLVANVTDGPERGKFCGEILQRSSVHIPNDIDASAIKSKTTAFMKFFGIGWNSGKVSHEEFLFRPFLADVRSGRIAAISTDAMNISVFPMSGLSERPKWDSSEHALVWSTSIRYNEAA